MSLRSGVRIASIMVALVGAWHLWGGWGLLMVAGIVGACRGDL